MAVARAARSSLKEIEACDPPLPEGHSPDAVAIQLLDHRIMPKLPDPYGVIPKRRQLASDLVDAVRASNVERFDDAFEALGEDDEALTRAMRGVAKLPRPSTEFQSYCFDLWLRNGNYLRGQINGANVLAAGLRVLLPPYTGPALLIYRGDSWFNRRRRTYGPSWTTSIEVAHHFASDMWRRTCVGGSVLLETMATAEAIVCAPGQIDNRYCEDEIVVEPRRLGKVKLVERFEQTA
jgi:hypothetical protein